MPQWEPPAASLGNERQGCIVLPKVPHAQSERHLLIHARDRDFAQRANREQRLPDVQAIGGSRRGLTTGSREIQPALSLSWFFGICVFRNNFAPRLGATLASSGRNAKFWQYPLRQDHIGDNECHSPNPIGHVHLLLSADSKSTQEGHHRAPVGKSRLKQI
jgi:hypothetical protein